MRTLVLGGIRSGKSRWAEEAIAESVGAAPVRYLATGPTSDDDSWSARVAAHQLRRPAHWETVESPDVATQLRGSPGDAALVDDIGTWLAAVMDRCDAWAGGSFAEQVDDLVDAIEVFGSPLVLVSPEVGLTVVPATEAGRRFADALGSLNQRLATVCDRVVLVVAGQPVQIKPQRLR
jgi:adenosylcobinamide kinase / adenosylcobinamide-phosphate guanylyltransferase